MGKRNLKYNIYKQTKNRTNLRIASVFSVNFYSSHEKYFRIRLEEETLNCYQGLSVGNGIRTQKDVSPLIHG